jgi:hypothetical protein
MSITCTPNSCQGGTCTNNICICTDSDTWQRQFSLIKTDCSQPKFLLQIGASLNILASILTIIQILRRWKRARSTVLQMLQNLLVTHICSILTWICILIEDGLMMKSLIFWSLYYLFLFRFIYYSLVVIILPTLGMKPSRRNQVQEILKRVISISYVILQIILVVATYYAGIQDIDNLNTTLMTFSTVLLLISLILIATTAVGLSRLQVALRGGNNSSSEIEPSLNNANNSPTMNVNHRSAAAATATTASMANNNNNNSNNSGNNTAMDAKTAAIQRLEKLKTNMKWLLIGSALPLGFSLSYFILKRAPGFDIYFVVSTLNLTVTQYLSVEQSVPKSSSSPETTNQLHLTSEHGTNNLVSSRNPNFEQQQQQQESLHGSNNGGRISVRNHHHDEGGNVLSVGTGVVGSTGGDTGVV